jgi:hypothetical protein
VRAFWSIAALSCGFVGGLYCWEDIFARVVEGLGGVWVGVCV